jgi:hypothetical protein
MMITSQSSSHWYTKDGEPCYEVPYKDPRRGVRRTTLRDARKLNLVPSVTTITKIIDNPILDTWKTNQAVMSALTLPTIKGESEESFARRLNTDASATAEKAANWGTAIHYGVEMYLTHGEICSVYDGYEIGHAVQAFATWWEQSGLTLVSVEEPFASELGYGGKIDIRCTKAIVDIKTKDTKEGQEVVAYPDNGYQAVAYKQGLRLGDDVKCVNVYLSRNDKRREAHIHVWDNEAELLEVFNCAFALWKAVKRYNPCKD